MAAARWFIAPIAFLVAAVVALATDSGLAATIAGGVTAFGLFLAASFLYCGNRRGD